MILTRVLMGQYDLEGWTNENQNADYDKKPTARSSAMSDNPLHSQEVQEELTSQ